MQKIYGSYIASGGEIRLLRENGDVRAVISVLETLRIKMGERINLT